MSQNSKRQAVLTIWVNGDTSPDSNISRNTIIECYGVLGIHVKQFINSNEGVTVTSVSYSSVAYPDSSNYPLDRKLFLAVTILYEGSITHPAYKRAIKNGVLQGSLLN